ncbi:MAG TPA: hypothetical protein VKS23_01450 [Thermoanaerobaculia bacterium]|nr:hypothetical protein [Thermoanaerobaculia bacterium]
MKHDVGKALRWSAPDERETNPDELRARLVADLLPRTTGGGASRDVLESFFEWKRDEGPLFASGDPDLEAVERAMTVVGRLASRLPPFEGSSLLSLDEESLVALDEACLEASRACTAFYRRVAVDDGPEIVRPLGARP